MICNCRCGCHEPVTERDQRTNKTRCKACRNWRTPQCMRPLAPKVIAARHRKAEPSKYARDVHGRIIDLRADQIEALLAKGDADRRRVRFGA